MTDRRTSSATVFVVLKAYAYEADELIVVCSTEEKAERCAAQGRQVYPSADLRVVEVTIDGRPPWEKEEQT